MLFRSNLDSGPKRKLYVYILFGFLQKGDVWGKNVCSPRPAPTIQSFPLHSTKPKESFKKKDAGAWGGGGGRSFFTDTGGWWLIRSGLTPKETQKELRTKKQNHPGRRWIFTRQIFAYVGHRQKCQIRMGEAPL